MYTIRVLREDAKDLIADQLVLCDAPTTDDYFEYIDKFLRI